MSTSTSTRAPRSMTLTAIDSPIGPLTLTAVDGLLAGVYMHEHRHAPALPAACRRDVHGFEPAIEQLEAYFAGTLTQFDLPLWTEGATEFQRRVWAALGEIPYGETISYGELARRLGRPGSSRAVGLANGRNPHSIVVACHRVVGSDGRLTGYGGGLERKLWLLEHEAAHRTCTPADSLYVAKADRPATLFAC